MAGIGTPGFEPGTSLRRPLPSRPQGRDRRVATGLANARYLTAPRPEALVQLVAVVAPQTVTFITPAEADEDEQDSHDHTHDHESDQTYHV